MDFSSASGERALFRTRSSAGVAGVSHDPSVLGEGFHVVVMTFEGKLHAVRMREVLRHDDEPWLGACSIPARRAVDPAETASWVSSLDQHAYENGVRAIQAAIASGDVYQANLCRLLSRDGEIDMDALFAQVLSRNPAPYACRIDVAGHLDVVSASPELFLERHGTTITSAPIKGTATTLDAMLAKDATENIMITDLVRNDLQRVCEAGTVRVDGLLAPQQHPGLVHLVSTVRGRLRDGVAWADILSATFPPGSVSGAPKLSALDVIARLEVGARGPYCGAIGWVDADRGEAELAVGIRTFWRDAASGRDGEPVARPIGSRRIHFGAGAGITWDSQPQAEWDETTLKAHRLLAIADDTAGRER